MGVCFAHWNQKNLPPRRREHEPQTKNPEPEKRGRLTRRELFLVGGAALLATRLHAAPDKDPNLIVLLDFVQDAVDARYLSADLEIRRGVTEASANADFQVRLSGTVAIGGGTFFISPKGDPIAALFTKSETPTPNGSTEVRKQFSNRYKGAGGTGSVTLLIELLKPNGSLMATSSLTKPGLVFA